MHIHYDQGLTFHIFINIFCLFLFLASLICCVQFTFLITVFSPLNLGVTLTWKREGMGNGVEALFPFSILLLIPVFVARSPF